jgi:5-methylcytosine-specific restriction endonuclease McrA
MLTTNLQPDLSAQKSSEVGSGRRAKTPRKEFSRATKRAAWERCGGWCEGQIIAANGERVMFIRCNAPLGAKFTYDHRIPDWIGGDNALDNCQVLCPACDKPKTAIDQGVIAKSKRIQDKRIRAKTTRNPLPGSRASGWKKTFNHGWVRR